MTVPVNGSVSVVTHKLTDLNKTCMDAILKALSIMNENRRNEVLTVIKQLKCESTIKKLVIKSKYSCDLDFNVSS